MAKYVTEDNLVRYDTALKLNVAILARGTTYRVGTIVQKGQDYLKCVKSGTTATTALSISGSYGTILTDGSVEWQIIDYYNETKVFNWQADVVYEVGRIVLKDSIFYRCKVAHTAGSTFDSAKWERVGVDENLPPKVSEWSATTVYKKDQLITYNGTIYKCKSDHTSGTDFSRNSWEITYSNIRAWQPSTVYLDGETVLYGGSIYSCNSSHTSAADNFDISRWNLITSDLHYWASGTQYKVGVTVLVGKDIYVCTTANADTNFTASKWQRLGTSMIEEWVNNRNYIVGEVVTVNGLLYRCTSTHTSEKTFNKDKGYWSLIYANVQEWANTKSYKKGELVIHKRRLYRAISDASTSSFLSTYWEEISPTMLDDWKSYASSIPDFSNIYCTFDDSNDIMMNYIGTTEVCTTYSGTIYPSTPNNSATYNNYAKIGSGSLVLAHTDATPGIAPRTVGWCEEFGAVYEQGLFHDDTSLLCCNLENFALTMEWWACPAQNSAAKLVMQMHLGKATSDGTTDYYTSFGDWFGPLGAYFPAFSGTPTVVPQEWHHFAFELWCDSVSDHSVDNSAKWKWQWYLDGVPQGVQTSPYNDPWYIVGRSDTLKSDLNVRLDIQGIHYTAGKGLTHIDDLRYYSGLRHNGVAFTPETTGISGTRNYAYIKNEAVVHDGKLYRCVVDYETDTDWNKDHWELIGGSESSTAQIAIYTNNTEYLAGDTVTYDGRLFRCTVGHTSTSTFNPDNWEVLYSSIKAWHTSTVYKQDEEVIYNNKIYKCNTTHTSDSSNFTNDISNWNLISGGSSSSSIKMWSPSTSYSTGDLVIYNAVLYRCINANSDSTFTPSNWQAISAANVGIVDTTLWSGTFNSVSEGDTFNLSHDYSDYNEILLLVNGNVSRSFSPSLASSTGFRVKNDMLGSSFDTEAILSFSGSTATANEWRYGVNVGTTVVSIVGRKYKSAGSGGTTISDWATSTDYNAGDLVLQNNSIYRCLTAHTSDKWLDDASKWQMISAIKDWQPSTVYIKNDLVVYENQMYRVVKSFTSGSTFSDTDLELYVPKGLTNAQIQAIIKAWNPSASGGYPEWEANTDYEVDDKLIYEGQIYKVTTAFTSGATFDDTNLEEYIPIGLTSTQLTALENAFNPSGSGSGSAVNYSTTEQNTGVKWIDGKDIYQCTYTGFTIAVGSIDTVIQAYDTTSLNIDTVVDLDAIMYSSVGDSVIGNFGQNSTTGYIDYWTIPTAINFRHNGFGGYSIIATIKYTKQ